MALNGLVRGRSLLNNKRPRHFGVCHPQQQRPRQRSDAEVVGTGLVDIEHRKKHGCTMRDPTVHKSGELIDFPASSPSRLQQTEPPSPCHPELTPRPPSPDSSSTKGGDAVTYLPQQARPGPQLRPRRRRAHRRGPEGDDDFALGFRLLSQAPLSSSAPARTKTPPQMGVASLCRVSRTEGFRW